jgi:hypothetical protein
MTLFLVGAGGWLLGVASVVVLVAYCVRGRR